MKKVLLLILVFLIEVGYAQFIPHKATITLSKDSVLSSEEFILTYSLSEVEGYIYIGVEWGYFDVIGNDRWEGFIKMGETKTITFTLKLKENSKAGIEEKVPLAVGFSRKPFGERILGSSELKSVLITITDFTEFRPKIKGNLDNCDSLYQTKGSSVKIDLEPQIIISIPTKTKTIFKNPETPNLEYFSDESSYYYGITEMNSTHSSSKLFKDSKSNFDKSTANLNKISKYEITVQFYATSVSFRNSSNQQLPWQYYTVEIWGLQSPNDPNPVVIEQQIIESSTTGGFTISTIQNYPYYQCALSLE